MIFKRFLLIFYYFYINYHISLNKKLIKLF